MNENRFRKGDWANCRYDICEIVNANDEVVCIVSLNDADKVIQLLESNERLNEKIDNLIERAKNSESSNEYKLGVIQALQTLQKDDFIEQ